MSAEEDRLYGLMEIAERQQAAVQAALDGLVAERAALARERERLAREVAALGQGTRQAVNLAVAEGFAGAAGKGVEAVQIATKPLLGKLAGVTEGAERAEAALRRVVSWASWRLLGWIAGLMVALVLLGWLTGNALVWWDTGTVENLQGEITELQANHAAFVRAGMLGKLTYCDPGNRPCIRVDESAGAFGTNGDYRIIMGY
jgi:type II secretory pathway component PulL